MKSLTAHVFLYVGSVSSVFLVVFACSASLCVGFSSFVFLVFHRFS